MLILCCIISISSWMFYYKLENINNRDRDIIQREAVVAKDKEKLNVEREVLNKDKGDLDKLKGEAKVKEKEIANKDKELKDKEEELKQKEIELKAKEEEVEKKLIANRTKPSTTGGSDRVAYLTFDDGPSANTQKILDILAANKIKATFFVNGHIGFESTYLRMVNEGHKIGNHTYSHNYSEVYSLEDGFFNSVNQLNNYLASLGISKPDIIRFPGGSNNTVSYQYGGSALMGRLVNSVVNSGYDYFDWNVSSGDASKPTADKESIISNVKSGCTGKKTPIILMHDSAPKTTTAESLQEIINYLRAQGYSFGTLEKGIGVSAKFK